MLLITLHDTKRDLEIQRVFKHHDQWLMFKNSASLQRVIERFNMNQTALKVTMKSTLREDSNVWEEV